MNTTNTETLIAVLGWSALVNYGILLVWLLMLVLARDWIRALHSKIMGLDMSSEEFGRMHYLLNGAIQDTGYHF